MRTNIVINDSLMSKAMKAAGLKTKKETVEQGLKLLLQVKGQSAARALKGAINWQGNLDDMRTDK